MLIGVYWHCHGRDKVFIRKLRYSEILVSCVWRISLVDYVFNFALAFFVFILFIMRYSLPFPCLPFLPFYRILHFTSWTRMSVRFPKVKLKEQKLQNLSRFARRYFHPESLPLYLGTFLFLFPQRHAIQESPHSDLVLWPVCSAHRRITLVFLVCSIRVKKRKRKKCRRPVESAFQAASAAASCRLWDPKRPRIPTPFHLSRTFSWKRPRGRGVWSIQPTSDSVTSRSGDLHIIFPTLHVLYMNSFGVFTLSRPVPFVKTGLDRCLSRWGVQVRYFFLSDNRLQYLFGSTAIEKQGKRYVLQEGSGRGKINGVRVEVFVAPDCRGGSPAGSCDMNVSSWLSFFHLLLLLL